MLKKLALLGFLCLAIFCFAAGSAEAAAKVRIGVIVKTERFELDEQVRQRIFLDLQELFPGHTYQLLQNEQLEKDLNRYLANKMHKEPAQTEKIALLELAKNYKYDCLLLLSYELETAANNNNFLKWEKNAIVTLKARMMYQKTANYIYANNIIRADSAKLKKFKDISNVSDVASMGAEKCNEHLFSHLELPLAKRTIELS